MTTTALTLNAWLEVRRRQVDGALEVYLPSPPSAPASVCDAMRYSVIAGGKRLRPMLVLAAAEAIADRAGTDLDHAIALALPAACAVELIHTYSLVHDDLPAMDNDTLRRGRPTNHVVFGEGMAILAGDALLTEAFVLLAREPATSPLVNALDLAVRKLDAIRVIAEAAGAAGMVGGQAVDLQAAAPGADPLDGPALQGMHARKTGALIRGAAGAGAAMAGASPAHRAAIDAYAEQLGLAFQIVDDILDVEGASADLGQDRRQRRGGRQADLPCAVRPGGIPSARRGLRRSRARRAAGTAARRSAPRHRRMGARAAQLKTTLRLDALLVERGLAASRERARALILAGQVRVDGQAITKAGSPVRPDATVELQVPDHPYVGRGGLKLEHALRTFNVDVTGRLALDIGASTGGFTDVMLKRGAARVVALDVGHGQLDWTLRTDPRVIVLERVNARTLTPDQLPPDARLFGIVTIDVSFISLRQVLPVVPPLLAPRSDIIVLVKPQFEAGRREVGKGGIVRDAAVQARVIEEVTNAALALGLSLAGSSESPITGMEGNQEYLLHLTQPDA